MLWNNAVRDPLPETSKVVLLSYKGVYHIAFFNSQSREFHLASGSNMAHIKPDSNLYWSDLAPLPKRTLENILLVEDDPDDKQMIEHELRTFFDGTRVSHVEDGRKAIDFMLKRDRYVKAPNADMVILDLNLPVVDGFGVLEERKKHQTLMDIPVYVVSTTSDTSQWEKALNLGARCFYSKGTSSQDISRIIREISAARALN